MLYLIDFCKLGSAAQRIIRYVSADECKLVPRTSERTALLGFMQSGYSETWLLQLYAVVWWYGPSTVTQISKLLLASAPLGPWPWPRPWPLVVGAPLALLCLTYWAGDSWAYGHSVVFQNWHAWNLFSVVFALLTVLVIAICAKSPWFPMSTLDYLGRCSIGTYIIHYYVHPSLLGIPLLTQILPAWSGFCMDGLLKFATCIMYCALYAATIGYVFQVVVVERIADLISVFHRAIALPGATLHKGSIDTP